jgi:hypothetical protein
MSAPTFPIGGPSTSAWREEMLTQAQELSGLYSWVAVNIDPKTKAGDLPTAIENELRTARMTAAGEDTHNGDGRALRWWTRARSSSGGAAFERTRGNLDAAEVNLLRLAPADYVMGQMPNLLAHVNRYLPKGDPRRARIDALATSPPDVLSDRDRNAVVGAIHAANSQRRRDLQRVRSFGNLLIGATVTLCVLAVSAAIISGRNPTWLPLCFLPEDQNKFVCPLQETNVQDPSKADIDQLVSTTAQPEDMLLVELVGLVAAALAGALALRGIRGSSTPYKVPLALILLKLPTGALTAVIGILFMRGGFVPGLTALDSSAQIIAWAVIFGYGQQAFTRLIDSQGQDLLQDVAGHGAAGDRGTKAH